MIVLTLTAAVLVLGVTLLLKANPYGQMLLDEEKEFFKRMSEYYLDLHVKTECREVLQNSIRLAKISKRRKI